MSEPLSSADMLRLEKRIIELEADKQRVDRFLYLSLCMDDEGWHPLNRDEFDSMLDSVEASREEETRLREEEEGTRRE